MLEFLSNGLRFLAELKTMEAKENSNKKAVNDLDKATQDVLHKVELDEKMNQSEKAKQVTLLRNIRRDRRYYKDKAEFYEAINAIFEDGENVSFKKGLNKMFTEFGKIRAKYTNSGNRTYRPKFIKTLQIKQKGDTDEGKGDRVS